MAERTPFPGLSFAGDVALVTGGASGIGLEAALTFADLGADVAIVDRDMARGKAAQAQIEAIGRRSIAIVADVSSADQVDAAFAQARDALGDVGVAVACAAILGDYLPIDRVDPKMFDDVMNVNVGGSFLVVRAAAEQMRRRGGGAIVLISSADGLQAEHGMSAYCTSKGAILNLVRSAALDFAREGIRVNAVCPSVTMTPLLEGRLATLPDGDAVLARYASKHPLGRNLTVRDIAAAIAFLASPLAGGITGTSLAVDAGIGATWDWYETPAWVGAADR
jgi:NAD(P)-dependent dehydrogenase (short-subunit alcohol dehydrogenase family)